MRSYNKRVLAEVCAGIVFGAIITFTCLQCKKDDSEVIDAYEEVAVCDSSLIYELREQEDFQKGIIDDMFWSFAEVESGCNPSAHSSNHDAAGIIQITPVMLKQVNMVRKRHGKAPFSASDRYSEASSREMFEDVMREYNSALDIDRAIDLWNGRCGRGYRERVTNIYEELRKERSDNGR